MAPWRAPSPPRRNGASRGAGGEDPPGSRRDDPPRSAEDWRALVGRKVSIRYHLRDNAAPFSEAIGVVQAVRRAGPEPGRVCLLTRKGKLVCVGLDDVVAAKIFSLPRR